MPIHLTRPDVHQLEAGGFLLVWRLVQSSDPVVYSVQYSTDGKKTLLTDHTDYYSTEYIHFLQKWLCPGDVKLR